MRGEKGGEGDRRGEEVRGGERRELVHQTLSQKLSHLDNKHMPAIFQLCPEIAS